ncbi:ABC transporter ATP-binding protein [Caldifermentibacillus hisashii]|uniref:ABC transporter ATP-binding protein n=1 Tax=Bacillaceae TaxID=186817 RepID=UPI001D075DF4|nr:MULTISPECIES: ABC transporter ATP-binding protein [unclassified Caldibacillus]MCB7069233.1 ABC transporter ATP-binding protein [Caldibacillus sp. 210928-DFI.2.22]MCB7072657.1 ABC transporter ATP-binding protein [Caldibacillus sp. 210928-DFI.2.18]
MNIKNLSKAYPGFLLDNVNLELFEGDIMGLVGENGAGKTTLIKLLLNLINADKGEILIFGKNYENEEKFIKNKIGIVFDENYLHELLTANQFNYIMSQIYGNWDKNVYYDYLDKFKLPQNVKVKTFSKGMKVKLNFSVALSVRPKLLILDEATSGLDPMMRVEILDVIENYVHQYKCTVLISSHILSDFERIANKITLIHKGRLIFSDKISNITQEDSLENIMSKHIKGDFK